MLHDKNLLCNFFFFLTQIKNQYIVVCRGPQVKRCSRIFNSIPIDGAESKTRGGKCTKDEDQEGGNTTPTILCTANVGKQEHGYRCVTSVADCGNNSLGRLTAVTT